MQNITTVSTRDISENLHQNVDIKRSSSEDKTSIVSIVCRICYDNDKEEPIIAPCQCKGTVAFVHCSCLEMWLAESNTTSCELCHHVFKTERTPKYTATHSICRSLRYPPDNLSFHVRGLRSDILACTILTPLAIMITYICLFSADYYSQKRFDNVPAAKWTSISLLIMISIMLVGYYLWVFMVVRYHGRIWYYCWQRECVVRIIAPSSQNICCNDVNATNNYEDHGSLQDKLHDCEDLSSISIEHANNSEQTAVKCVTVDINRLTLHYNPSQTSNCVQKRNEVNHPLRSEDPSRDIIQHDKENNSKETSNAENTQNFMTNCKTIIVDVHTVEVKDSNISVNETHY